MTAPVVFLARRGNRKRLFWLERGYLFTWARVLCRWVFHVGSQQVTGGNVLTRDQVLQLTAERGTPFRPRVEAGAWLPCLECGFLAGEPRVYFGARGPFCGELHREQWLHRQPVIDHRSTRG